MLCPPGHLPWKPQAILLGGAVGCPGLSEQPASSCSKARDPSTSPFPWRQRCPRGSRVSAEALGRVEGTQRTLLCDRAASSAQERSYLQNCLLRVRSYFWERLH